MNRSFRSHVVRSQKLLAGALVALGVMMGTGSRVHAQGIVFKSDLPRTLVFINEEGNSGTATRDVMSFLQEAKFPLVDPALAHTGAQRELVKAALAGDEGAAVQLGRDFGAQVLVLGKADWGTTPDPVSGKLQTGTSEVSLRALRLDEGKVVALGHANGRKLDATEQAARTGAIHQAVASMLQKSEFVGSVVNNWDEQAWSTRGYFNPDPGSPGAMQQQSGGDGSPKLAILRTDVLPPMKAGVASRGIGVVKKGDAKSGITNDVELEGLVVGAVSSVDVEGTKAKLTPIDAAEAKKLGVDGAATRFIARVTLPQNKDSVKVIATSPTGQTANAVAAPRIGERWAVVVGVSDYKATNIPHLRYAAADAQSFYDFLTSPSAGPFKEDHILFLKDGAATNQAIREAMFVFLQKANWNDLVVIYFAGHGAPDPSRPENLYLLPTDADVSQLASTGFPMWDVKTALRRQIKAERVLVIADACHSGGTKDGANNHVGGAFAELFTPSRRLTLTAADDNELSYEDSKWGGGHGVFTYNLLEGLKGAADADKNGIVTFAELSDYVAGKVKTETGGRQNPQRSGLGDIPLSVSQVVAVGGTQ
jgi:hypothetical protein